MSKSIRPEPANALYTAAEPKRWIDALYLTLRHLSALESTCLSEEARKQVAFLSSFNHLPKRRRQGARCERTSPGAVWTGRGVWWAKWPREAGEHAEETRSEERRRRPGEEPTTGNMAQGGDVSPTRLGSRARAALLWASLPQIKWLTSPAEILAGLWLEGRVGASSERRDSQESHREEVKQQITKWWKIRVSAFHGDLAGVTVSSTPSLSCLLTEEYYKAGSHGLLMTASLIL